MKSVQFKIKKLSRRQNRRKKPVILPIELIRRVIDSCKWVRNQLIIEILYVSSMRVKELVLLRVEDIKFELGEGYYHTIRCGKGGKLRAFYINREVLVKLGKELKGRTTGFAIQPKSGTGAKAMCTKAMYSVCRKAASQVEVDGKSPHINSHLLMHCYATHMAEHGYGREEIASISATLTDIQNDLKNRLHLIFKNK